MPQLSVAIARAALWMPVFAGLAPIVALENEELLVASAAAEQRPCDFSHWHPRRYPTYHLSSTRTSALTIDGRLDELAWEDAPWSEPFQDIRGLRHWSQPWFTTRVKMLYDDEFLYVAAYLEEDSVWANVTRRNDVVFHDNDFEVFVDPDGSTHNYKEFEVNAINTTWNLWLNRPYRNGGHENSTRVDPQFGFDMFGKGMKSAAFSVGPPNEPRERLHFWTTEIALPLKELAFHTKATTPPAPYSFWRINFSRVEWSVQIAAISSIGNGDDHGKWRYEKIPGTAEENWVWSAQYAVNMHRPEWWGYLQFRSADEQLPRNGDAMVPLDPEWDVRYLSFQFYYAQHRYFDTHHEFASSLALLQPFYEANDAYECTNLDGFESTNDSFVARIQRRQSISAADFTATISSDSHITVKKAQSVSAAYS